MSPFQSMLAADPPEWTDNSIVFVNTSMVQFRLPTGLSLIRPSSFFRVELLVNGEWFEAGFAAPGDEILSLTLPFPDTTYSLRVEYSVTDGSCSYMSRSAPLAFKALLLEPAMPTGM